MQTMRTLLDQVRGLISRPAAQGTVQTDAFDLRLTRIHTREARRDVRASVFTRAARAA